MIGDLIRIFVAAMQAVMSANGQAEAEEEALMRAEAELAALRARRKFQG